MILINRNPHLRSSQIQTKRTPRHRKARQIDIARQARRGCLVDLRLNRSALRHREAHWLAKVMEKTTLFFVSARTNQSRTKNNTVKRQRHWWQFLIYKRNRADGSSSRVGVWPSLIRVRCVYRCICLFHKSR